MSRASFVDLTLPLPTFMAHSLVIKECGELVRKNTEKATKLTSADDRALLDAASKRFGAIAADAQLLGAQGTVTLSSYDLRDLANAVRVAANITRALERTL